jgi:NB-ARC domain/Helix-turn-helix domain
MRREMNLGAELRAWRGRRGYSLRRMAPLLACDFSRVGKIERGVIRMTREVADAADKALDTGGALVAAWSAAQPSIRPAQLPAAPPTLVGRDKDLAVLAAGVRDRPPGTPAVVALDGPAGVGKTALALRWAHQVARDYVDGQLYADLQGFAPAEHREQVTAHGILGEFLAAMGAVSIPDTTRERAALYRSLMADRKVLVVLDNIADLADIELLLPASPECAVVVTSRRMLSGLVGQMGATRVTVRPLEIANAVALVSVVVGPERATADITAITALARLCGQLPIALQAAAEQIAGYPHRHVAGMVEELTAEGEQWLSLGETADIATVLSWSYQRLAPDAAQMFRLLGLHDGPNLSVTAVAALAGITIPLARRLLHRLATIHLVDIDAGDVVRLHPLTRVYARELVLTEDIDIDRHAAAQRLVTWYLHAVQAVHQLMTSGAPTVMTPPVSVNGVWPLDFPTGRRQWPGATRNSRTSPRSPRWLGNTIHRARLVSWPSVSTGCAVLSGTCPSR